MTDAPSVQKAAKISMPLKYVIGTGTDPYRNLAMETELMRLASADAPILFLWQNENTIVIGRNQEPMAECRMDEFLASGGRIARRKSGGGAVFHDMGNLNFSIICDKSDVEKYAYQGIVAAALDEYGIKTVFNGRNDLTTTDGRKFSGNAAYYAGDILCQHGTILIKADIEKMTYFLTPEQSKLDRNHVSSVASRVVNLSELSDAVTVDSMRQAMIRATGAEMLDCEIDRENYENLVGFYSSREWINEGVK